MSRDCPIFWVPPVKTAVLTFSQNYRSYNKDESFFGRHAYDAFPVSPGEVDWWRRELVVI